MMKNQYSCKWLRAQGFVLVKCTFLLALFALIVSVNIASFAQGVDVSPDKIKSEDIIATIRVGNFNDFDPLAANVKKNRSQYVNLLLKIFKDARASDYQKCATAYFLGEMRAPEAVDDLASNIKLCLTNSYPGSTRTYWPSVTGALIKIGSPSIPALIRNLQESDDAQVRKNSLEVLCYIDDKDIVQLRLQKTIDIQSDATKKARLQAAINSLPEIKIRLGSLN